MKQLTLIMALIVIVGDVSLVSGSTIAVYSDATFQDCVIRDSGLMTLYVIHSAWSGAKSVSFSLPTPDCMKGVTFFGFTTPFTNITGDIETGVTVEYGSCHSSYILLFTITAFGSGQSDDCCLYMAQPHPNSTSGKIEAVDCNNDILLSGASAAFINPDGSCDCDHYTIPPYVSNPAPSDSAADASVHTILRWDTYDPMNGYSDQVVYFGTSPDPPVVARYYEDNTFDPGELLPLTTYHWRIGVWDRWAERLGPVWGFTTGDPSLTKQTTWGAIKALYR